jgi:hypothetical protein
MVSMERRLQRVLVRKGALMILAALALLAAGCAGSSDDDEDTTSPPPAVAPAVPPARSEPEWIRRLVNRFLIDMNENLRVVTSLGTDEVQLYLRTGNQQSIGVLRKRMTDLRECSGKLRRVGPPPTESGPLVGVYENLQRSCPHYERLARAVLTSIPLLSSGKADQAAKGEAELAKAYAPSREAARHYGAAVQIIEQNGLLSSYQG